MELRFLRFLNKPAVIWILETSLVSWILSLCLPWLEKNDPLPGNPTSVRFIFLISYAATPERLTVMSRRTTELAAQLAKAYPRARVIGCEFKNNPTGAHEWDQKLLILPFILIQFSQLIEKASWAGLATSTTDERELLVQKALEFARTQDEDVLNRSIIVGGGGHIKRVSIVWKHYHTHTKLYFRCTDAREDDDLENPMTAQRRWQTWVAANLVGILFYKLLGVEYFAKKNLSQPTS